MGRAAIFIDGEYLKFVLRDEFGAAPVDFRILSSTMAGPRELLRTYYYCCLPYQSAEPTPDERYRFGQSQKFHDALRRIPRFDIRLGKLARRTDSDGSIYYLQKQVDILLGVDLVTLAAKGQITDAIILAGDSDFLPAIEVAKREGVAIHLYHGAYPHSDLVAAADERYRIDSSLIEQVRWHPRLHSIARG